MTTRQLKRRVPSGAQLPQRWRWSRIRTSGVSGRPSPFPPYLHCLRQSYLRASACDTSVCNDLPDPVVTIGIVQLEQERRCENSSDRTVPRGEGDVSRLDDQTHVATQVGERFTADKALALMELDSMRIRHPAAGSMALSCGRWFPALEVAGVSVGAATRTRPLRPW